MNRLAALALALTLAGCSALGNVLGAKPDPKPAANLAHVQRLVAADPKPEDAAPNAQALTIAQGIAAEADKSADVGGAISGLGAQAAGTGTPAGVLIGTILGVIGTAFTIGKTVYRTVKGQPDAGTLAAMVPAPAAPPAKPAA